MALAIICKHCNGDIRIANPSGFCSHVHYPEACPVCLKASKASCCDQPRTYCLDCVRQLMDKARADENGKYRRLFSWSRLAWKGLKEMERNYRCPSSDNDAILAVEKVYKKLLLEAPEIVVGCPSCMVTDTPGQVYNNADVSSGQWVTCDCVRWRS